MVDIMETINFFKKKYVAGFVLLPAYLFVVSIWFFQQYFEGLALMAGGLFSIFVVGYVYECLVIESLCTFFYGSKLKVISFLLLSELIFVLAVMAVVWWLKL